MEQQTNTVIFQLYISCTLTLSNRDNIMEQQIWPLWQKNKNIGIAI